MPKWIVLIGVPSLVGQDPLRLPQIGAAPGDRIEDRVLRGLGVLVAGVLAAGLAGVDDAQVPSVVVRRGRAAEAELVDRSSAA